MPAAKVFISQAAIDAWVSSDQAEISGSVLSFRGRPGALTLVPAAFFRSVSGGKQDANALIGKVKDEESVLVLGGETYMSSVLIGETAYDIEPGFLGTPVNPGEASAVVSTLRALPL